MLYNTIKTYFIEGTSMSKQAYNWAHGIDINFTSRHKLKDPTFTNEKLNYSKLSKKHSISKQAYTKKVKRILAKLRSLITLYYEEF